MEFKSNSQQRMRNHRYLLFGLFALLGLNSWLGTQETISIHMMSSNAPTPQIKVDSLNGCRVADGSVCVGEVQARSGRSTERFDFRVTFGGQQVEARDVVDYVSRQRRTIPAGWENYFQIETTSECSSCGAMQSRHTITATNTTDILKQVANQIQALASKAAREKEQARLDEEKQKKIDKAQAALDKAVERCERKDDGTKDTNGIPTGARLDHDERLECMMTKMDGMSRGAAQAYLDQHILPYIDQLMGSTQAGDRAIAASAIENLQTSHLAVAKRAGHTFARAAEYQRMIATVASRYGASANNPQVQAALAGQLQQIQHQISNDPVMRYGVPRSLQRTLEVASVSPRSLTNFGGTTALAEVETERIPQLGEGIQGATAGVGTTVMRPTGRVVNVAGRPRQEVIGPNGRPIPDLSVAAPVFGNSCATRGVGCGQDGVNFLTL